MSSAAVPSSASAPGGRSLVGGLSTTRVRVSSWQGTDGVALIGPGRASMLPSAHDIDKVVARLAQRGVQRAVTPALSHRDAQPFLRAGFTIHEQLHLLALDLRNGPEHRSHGFTSALPEGYELRA
ncbi:MAG: hypothetical protein ACR2NL_04020, partial [Acidimicrobiia bacterium]